MEEKKLFRPEKPQKKKKTRRNKRFCKNTSQNKKLAKGKGTGCWGGGAEFPGHIKRKKKHRKELVSPSTAKQRETEKRKTSKEPPTFGPNRFFFQPPPKNPPEPPPPQGKKRKVFAEGTHGSQRGNSWGDPLKQKEKKKRIFVLRNACPLCPPVQRRGGRKGKNGRQTERRFFFILLFFWGGVQGENSNPNKEAAPRKSPVSVP